MLAHPDSAAPNPPRSQLTDLDREEFESLIEAWRQDGVDLLEIGGLPETRDLAVRAFEWAEVVRSRMRQARSGPQEAQSAEV